MTVSLAEFAPLATEIILLVMACAILVIDVFLDDRRRVVSYVLSQATLLIAALVSWSLLEHPTMVVLKR